MIASGYSTIARGISDTSAVVPVVSDISAVVYMHVIVDLSSICRDIVATSIVDG
jgi:hypothetical protein